MDTFVARQPIFDRAQKVVAYELLFRSGPENFCSSDNLDNASSSVISDTLHVFGNNELTGGKLAYVNVSRQTLLNGFPLLLPPKTTVVELLESVKPDPEVMAACKVLKQAGYKLALDDFVFSPGFEPLVPFVDVVKIDFMNSVKEDRDALYRKLSPRGVRFLAEKVETRAEFDEARNGGYDFFQGYFASRPEVISRKAIPTGKRGALSLIRQLNRRELDHAALEETIEQDPALTLKLLRYLNSAFFGLSSRVQSIRHAMNLLGDGPLRTWASLIAMSAIGSDKPAELLVTSLIRARFCETAGVQARAGFARNELFLAGMVSTFDALLDTPIEQVLSEMSVSGDISDALTGRGGPLSPLYETVTSIERGAWAEAGAWAAGVGLNDGQLAKLYRESMLWADKVQQFQEQPRSAA